MMKLLRSVTLTAVLELRFPPVILNGKVVRCPTHQVGSSIERRVELKQRIDEKMNLCLRGWAIKTLIDAENQAQAQGK